MRSRARQEAIECGRELGGGLDIRHMTRSGQHHKLGVQRLGSGTCGVEGNGVIVAVKHNGGHLQGRQRWAQVVAVAQRIPDTLLRAAGYPERRELAGDVKDAQGQVPSPLANFLKRGPADSKLCRFCIETTKVPGRSWA